MNVRLAEFPCFVVQRNSSDIIEVAMNIKYWGSLFALVLGILLLVYGINSLQIVEPPKDFWQKTEDFFSNNPMWNPIINFFGGTPIKEPSRYPPSTIALIIIGSLLSIGGLIMVFVDRKRH